MASDSPQLSARQRRAVLLMELPNSMIARMLQELGPEDVQQHLLEIGQLPALPPQVREQVVAEFHLSAGTSPLSPGSAGEEPVVEHWLAAAQQLSQWGRWGEAARSLHRLAQLPRWSVEGRERLQQWVLQELKDWQARASRHSGKQWRKQQYQALLSLAELVPEATLSTVGPGETVRLAQTFVPDWTRCLEEVLTPHGQTQPLSKPDELCLHHLRSQKWAEAVEYLLDDRSSLERDRILEIWMDSIPLQAGPPLPSLLACLQELPFESELQVMLGYLYFESRQYPQAESSFRSVIRLNLNHRIGQLGLARTLQVRGERWSAILSYQKVLSLDPEQTTALERLGLLFEEVGSAEAAHYYFQAANLRLRQGNGSRARTLCQRALRLDSEHPGAKQMLVDLNSSPPTF